MLGELAAGGVAIVLRDDFIIGGVHAGIDPSQAVNMFTYDYSPMDNYSSFTTTVTAGTYTFQANTNLQGLFLGNVNFTRVIIDVYSDTGGNIRAVNQIVADIQQDSRDGLYKFWTMFTGDTQGIPVRRIQITPQNFAFSSSRTRIGALVFVKTFQILPRRPRQGLTESAQADYIRTGIREFPTGSPKISAQMSFRDNYSKLNMYNDFIRNSAGKLLIVIEHLLHDAVEDRQYGYFARRTPRVRLMRGESVNVSFDFVGEV